MRVHEKIIKMRLVKGNSIEKVIPTFTPQVALIEEWDCFYMILLWTTSMETLTNMLMAFII